jgi:predicted nucleotidyltransferase
MDNAIVLKDLKDLLLERFGPTVIDRIILFGSRITGAARDYSDYDILIILKTDYDWRKKDEILDVCFDICLKYDILIDAKVISTDELNGIRGKQPFILDALQSGLTL